MKIIDRWQRRCAVGLGLLLLVAAAQAQTNPFAKGPIRLGVAERDDRSVRGRHHVGVESRHRLRRRHDLLPEHRGLVRGRRNLPGIHGDASSIAWIGRRMASHGFVVFTINTNSTFDQPPSRATQLMAALRYLTNSSNSTVRSRVDANRLGVAGHSMGGGGSLMAARDNPSLKASVPMTPWSTTKSFSTVRVPVLVVGAESDTVAPVSSHSIPFYTSLASSLDKAYAELNNASHFAPNSTNTPIGRYSVAWVKRFMDNDTRYEPFLCGAPHAAFATPTVFSDYRSTCPYQ